MEHKDYKGTSGDISFGVYFEGSNNKIKGWELEKFQREEAKIIVSNNKVEDLGRSRKHICTMSDSVPEFKENRNIVVSAFRLAQRFGSIEFVEEILKTLYKEDEKSPYVLKRKKLIQDYQNELLAGLLWQLNGSDVVSAETAGEELCGGRAYVPIKEYIAYWMGGLAALNATPESSNSMEILERYDY